MSFDQTEIERLETLLAALGTTVDEVAHTLWEKRIWGIPQNAYTCPIHRYLTRVTAYPQWIGATSQMKTLVFDTNRLIIHPKPVQEFIREFDSGERIWVGQRGYIQPSNTEHE